MKHKILVLTAGTIAAGVGKEFLKQIAAHPASELYPSVRYMDTAYLPTRYSGLREGEWHQMIIDPRFIDSIRRNKKDYPHLIKLFYPDLYPQIQGSGGGSIRYNAAGAVAIGREKLKAWIHTSITDLIRSGGGQVRLSIALIISSVGATGSGTMERLIDLIVDAANDAQIPPPIHIDCFILQPGMQGVTDLGLANTLALYTELAASRLSKRVTPNKSYRGRTLMIGWGSERYLSSIEQLQEAAATLVRVTHDPATEIAAEFQEREVDNHVLRELDTKAHLPSHLSSATAITISLGNLEDKIIQRDAELLVDNIVLGTNEDDSAEESFIVLDGDLTDQQSGSLQDALITFLEGSLPEARYQHLLSRLVEVIDLQSLQLTAQQLNGMSAQEQAGKLRGIWQFDKDEISKLDRKNIQEQGKTLLGTALKQIERIRREHTGTGYSLLSVRNEYQKMHSMLVSTLKIAQDNARAVRGVQSFAQISADDGEVSRRLKELERAGRFTRKQRLDLAISSIQSDLQTRLRREAFAVGIAVLKELISHCAETMRDLDVVIQRTRKLRAANQGEDAEKRLRIEMNHPLQLAALSSKSEILKYAEQVSIFSPRTKVSGSLFLDDEASDPLAAFRKWLDDNQRLDILFEGKIESMLEAARDYARTHLNLQMEEKEISVINVLLQAGDDILIQRLIDAAGKAHSLVSFSTQFSEERREARHVSAKFSPDQYSRIQAAIDKAFGEGLCTLIGSNDPTEIAVFYYVDGLAMSAVNDLSGRCLNAFLKRRQAWYLQAEKDKQNSSNGKNPEVNADYNQRVGVPVYSSKEAQDLVLETNVIYQLYSARGQNVDDFVPENLPELNLHNINQNVHQDTSQTVPPASGNMSNGHEPNDQHSQTAQHSQDNQTNGGGVPAQPPTQAGGPANQGHTDNQANPPDQSGN